MIDDRSDRISQPARIEFEGSVHPLSGSRSKRLISVVLPVKNGGRGLSELLRRILAQRCEGCVEIVAVDSGSTDETREILIGHKARVLSVPAESFNCGRTRNLAAAHAAGEALVFVTARALPADDQWLANLIRPLEEDPRVAGVYSRILPRPDADLPNSREYLHSAWPTRCRRTITSRAEYEGLSPTELNRFIEFNNVSAAARPSVLAKIPFPEIDFAEDRLWAKKVLESGFAIHYEPSSVVLHSHNYTYEQLFLRSVDEGSALQDIVEFRMSQLDLALRVESMVRLDCEYLDLRCTAGSSDLEHWKIVSAMRRILQVAGIWLGSNRRFLTVSTLADSLQLLADGIPPFADILPLGDAFRASLRRGADRGEDRPFDPVRAAEDAEQAILQNWARGRSREPRAEDRVLVGVAMQELFKVAGLWLGTRRTNSPETSRLSLIDRVRRGSVPPESTSEEASERANENPLVSAGWRVDVAGLRAALEAEEADWQISVADRDRTIRDLQSELRTKVEERDRIIRTLHAELAKKTAVDTQIIRDLQTELHAKVGERDRIITALQAELHEKTGVRDQIIRDLQTELHAKVGERDRMIAALQNRLGAQAGDANPPPREESNGPVPEG